MIYLSIDLDYFTKRFPRALFDRLTGLNIPRRIVIEHEELLPHIHAQKFSTLVNADYHSDLGDMCDGQKPTFGCGTWVNYVRHIGKRKYIWSCPYSRACAWQGMCGSKLTFNDPRVTTGWKSATIRPKYWPRLSRVVAVGVAISPGFASTDVVLSFYKWLRFNHMYFSMSRAVAARVRLLRKAGTLA